MMQPNYRRRRPEVKALLLTESNGPGVASWCGGEYVDNPNGFEKSVLVVTETGTRVAIPGDYVVMDGGEASVWKTDAFEREFEEIPDV